MITAVAVFKRRHQAVFRHWTVAVCGPCCWAWDSLVCLFVCVCVCVCVLQVAPTQCYMTFSVKKYIVVPLHCCGLVVHCYEALLFVVSLWCTVIDGIWILWWRRRIIVVEMWILIFRSVSSEGHVSVRAMFCYRETEGCSDENNNANIERTEGLVRDKANVFRTSQSELYRHKCVFRAQILHFTRARKLRFHSQTVN